MFLKNQFLFYTCVVQLAPGQLKLNLKTVQAWLREITIVMRIYVFGHCITKIVLHEAIVLQWDFKKYCELSNLLLLLEQFSLYFKKVNKNKHLFSHKCDTCLNVNIMVVKFI